MGKSTLHDLELEELGDIRGKSLLHLQCHIGVDTLSLARLGARVTGVDFSDKAVSVATELSRELSIDGRFIQADVLELPRLLDEQFDIVYTSYGVLCWLPDLMKWGQVIGKLLKRGGRFVIVEDHPLAYVLDDDCQPDNLKIGFPYFDEAMLTITAKGTYATDIPFEQPMEIHEWTHPLQDIFAGLLGAGLRIDSFREYRKCAWKRFPWMVSDDNGWWHLPPNMLSVPLLFSLTATKE